MCFCALLMDQKVSTVCIHQLEVRPKHKSFLSHLPQRCIQLMNNHVHLIVPCKGHNSIIASKGTRLCQIGNWRKKKPKTFVRLGGLVSDSSKSTAGIASNKISTRGPRNKFWKGNPTVKWQLQGQESSSVRSLWVLNDHKDSRKCSTPYIIQGYQFCISSLERCHVLNDHTAFMHHLQVTWHNLKAVRTKAALVSALDLPLG